MCLMYKAEYILEKMTEPSFNLDATQIRELSHTILVIKDISYHLNAKVE